MISWDTQLEDKFRAEFENTDDDALKQTVLSGRGLTLRGRATYELTRRALDNHDLLTDALAAIDRDHVAEGFPPLGWVAAARILGSNDPAAVSALLSAISVWDVKDRRAFFEFCLPRGRRGRMLRDLAAAHGWSPGFELAS
jgi:hypothetical protein